MMKSRSLANKELEMAIRSMMGATCSAKERGWDSHNQSLALNLENTCCSQTLQYIECYIFSGSIINTIRGCETSNTLHILSNNKELAVEKRFKTTKHHKFRQHRWAV